jgi:hypothetical protein
VHLEVVLELRRGHVGDAELANLAAQGFMNDADEFIGGIGVTLIAYGVDSPFVDQAFDVAQFAAVEVFLVADAKLAAGQAPRRAADAMPMAVEYVQDAIERRVLM